MEATTPLYDRHRTLCGKMITYAGYLLPVEYEGIVKEHTAVRTGAGLFDVSHMGRFMFMGADVLKNINYVFTNDFTSMTDGCVRYTTMCSVDGGIIDDLLIYRLEDSRYMIVPNAANRERVFNTIEQYLTGEAALEDITDATAQLALQGPKSFDILRKITDDADIPGRYYTINISASVSGIDCMISRTGYTGEDGFELYCNSNDAEKLWDNILSAGRDYEIVPCGLGARDTLRIEASMPLYGHEMTCDITPLETGLFFAVKMDKEDFIGKKAIEAKGEPQIARVGLKITGRGIARDGNTVEFEGSRAGHVTSGTYCPYLGGAYAMALVDKRASKPGTTVKINVRGRILDAEVIPMPFIKRTSENRM